MPLRGFSWSDDAWAGNGDWMARLMHGSGTLGVSGKCWFTGLLRTVSTSMALAFSWSATRLGLLGLGNESRKSSRAIRSMVEPTLSTDPWLDKWMTTPPTLLTGMASILTFDSRGPSLLTHEHRQQGERPVSRQEPGLEVVELLVNSQCYFLSGLDGCLGPE